MFTICLQWVYNILKGIQKTNKMLEEPEKLVAIEPKKPRKRITRPRVETVPAVPPVSPVQEKPKRTKLIKGSQEAKDYMASIRAKRKPKQQQ